MRAATGDSVRSRRHATHTLRGGTAGVSGRMSTAVSRVSTASSGITAQPMPARTMASWAPLSLVRKTHVGSAPHGQQPVLDLLLAAARRVADERGVVEVDGGVGPGRQLAGRRHQHERVLEEEQRLEVAGARADGERQVELAGEHGHGAGVGVLVLEQADVEVGVLAAQPAHDGRQEHVGHALERPDVDAADLAGQEALDGLAGGVDPGDDVAGVAEHELAERGQLDRSGTARPVEHGPADEALEGGDLLADGRLGVAEAGGRPAERAFGGHGVEGDEVAELEVSQLAHVHQRSCCSP